MEVKAGDHVLFDRGAGIEIVLNRRSYRMVRMQDVRAVLEQSTLRGWRGVFAVKVDGAVPDYSEVIARIKD